MGGTVELTLFVYIHTPEQFGLLQCVSAETPRMPSATLQPVYGTQSGRILKLCNVICP